MNLRSMTSLSSTSRLVLGRRSLHGSSVRRGIMMPALSPFMTQGTVSRWLKKEGEAFEAGDVLLEIESEYATINVEAEAPGIMGKILSPDGSTNVPVEQVIALAARTPDEIAHVQASAQILPPPPPPLAPRQHPNRGAANLEHGKSLMMASVHRAPPSLELHHNIHSAAATVRGIATSRGAGSEHAPTPAMESQTHENDYDVRSPCTTAEASELRKTIVSTLSRRGLGAESSDSKRCTTAQYFEGLL
ncbi:Dihydrolipoyllysine-residue acetyltransferase [Mycena venus]|uniref:Dihydrolipoyllysine-residue acetyltransferase n=1 Tax=Mycena venus TaxID=2733690 RepID=A0A8H6Y8C0_9AGAR|nr:Dihydrolipoyllysine-residue acetyltransferase [Mycena venus]